MEKHTYEQFEKHINNLRLKGGRSGAWYVYIGTVEGKYVRLKGFQTYLQVYDVDGVRYGGTHCQSVRRFKAILKRGFGREAR
jgi:hypothetical protein